MKRLIVIINLLHYALMQSSQEMQVLPKLNDIDKTLRFIKKIWRPKAKPFIDDYIKKMHEHKDKESIRDYMNQEFDTVAQSISKLYLDLFLQRFGQNSLKINNVDFIINRVPSAFLKAKARHESWSYICFRSQECKSETIQKELKLKHQREISWQELWLLRGMPCVIL